MFVLTTCSFLCVCVCSLCVHYISTLQDKDCLLQFVLFRTAAWGEQVYNYRFTYSFLEPSSSYPSVYPLFQTRGCTGFSGVQNRDRPTSARVSVCRQRDLPCSGLSEQIQAKNPCLTGCVRQGDREQPPQSVVVRLPVSGDTKLKTQAARVSEGRER